VFIGVDIIKRVTYEEGGGILGVEKRVLL